MAGTPLVDLKVQKCAWVTTMADETAPTVAEVTAGVDLSCILTPDYNVDFTDSDTVSERALCQSSGAQTITVAHYEGNLTMFRQFTTGGAPDTTDPLTTFAPDTYPVGYFVRRVGPDQSTAFAAGDKVEVWKFQADNPKTKGGTNEGYLKCSVKLIEQGFVKIGVALT
jgi:hypothetical protein